MKMFTLLSGCLLLHAVSAQPPDFGEFGNVPGFGGNGNDNGNGQSPRSTRTHPDLDFTFPTGIVETKDVDLPSSCKRQREDYVSCCSQLFSDCAKDALESLKPKDLAKTSCSSLDKLFGRSASVTQVLNLTSGLESTSSPCLNKAIAAGFKHAYGPPKNWDSSVFKEAPVSTISQLDTSSLRGLSPSVWRNKESLNKLGEAMKGMTLGQVKSASSSLKKAYGDYSWWNSSTMDSVLTSAPTFVCGLDSKSIQSFQEESVVESFGKVISAVRSCDEETRNKVNFPQQFLSIFKNRFGDVDMWNISTFKSLGEFRSQLTPGALSKLHGDILEEHDTLPRGDKSFAPHQKLALAAALRRFLNASGNTSEILSQLLEKLPSIFSSLDESEIREANCSDVHKHFLASAFSRVPRLSSQALFQRAKECGLGKLKAGQGQTSPESDDISELKSDAIKTLSDYFASFKSSDLESLDKSELMDAFRTKLVGQTLQGLDIAQGRGLLRALQVHKIKKDTPAEVAIDELGELAGMLSQDEIENGGFNVMAVQNVSSEVFKKRPDLRRAFAEKVIAILGTNFSDSVAWPSNTKFGELGESIVTGFNRTTWRSLPDLLYEGFATQAAKFWGFSQGQAKQIMKRHFNVDWAKNASEEDVRELGSFICQLNSITMDALPDAAKMQVARNLGQSDRLAGFCGDKTRIQDLLNFALQTLRKSSPDNRISVTDIQTLGKLAQRLSSAQLDGMTKDDLEASTFQLTHDLDGDDGNVEEHLKKVAMAVYKKSAHNARTARDTHQTLHGLTNNLLQNLGPAVCYLHDDFFSSLSNKMTFDDQIDILSQQMCNSNSRAAESIVKAAMKHWGDVLQWVEMHVRRLNQSLAAMNSNDLSKLSQKVIVNTLDTLGKADFSRAKLTILANKLPNLTATLIKSLGRLSCVIPPNRLRDHLKDTDVLCSVSKHSCFTKTEKKEFLQMLKNVTKGQGTISSWGEHQLSCLGKFASELSPTDISSISDDALKSSVRSLGKEYFPDPAQRKAFSDRLKTVYGSVKNWKESEVSTMGGLIGHLGQGGTDSQCSSDVGQLTSDHIGAIDVSTIPQLYNLKCFSADQLKTFDGEQARAVTATQRKQLSSAQTSALVSVECDPDCSTQTTPTPTNRPKSGVGSVTISSFSLIGLLIFTILY